MKSKGRVFVQGDFANGSTRKLFADKGYEIVETIEDSDVVVFTGGEDINPAIYGEKPAGAHYWSEKRDKEDLLAIEKAGDRFKVGICRGAQLLNCVPNGGTLWQDVDKHAGSNHPVFDTVTGKTIEVNSLHHQQLRLTDKAELVAYTNLSTVKDAYSAIWHADNNDEDKDVEVAFYPETKSLLVQFHPEFSQRESPGIYFHDLMERYYLAA